VHLSIVRGCRIAALALTETDVRFVELFHDCAADLSGRRAEAGIA